MHIQNETETQSDCPDRGNFFAAIQCREIPDPECQVPRPRPQCREPEPEPNAEYYEDSSMPTSKASGIARYCNLYMYQKSSTSLYVHKALGFTSDEPKTPKLTNSAYIVIKASGIGGKDHGKY